MEKLDIGFWNSFANRWPITVQQLSSGYWHIRSRGMCNYSQPPVWPCDYDTLKQHAHPEAAHEFLLAAERHGSAP